MSDTREPKTVDVSALIAGDVQFVQVDVWTEGKGLHHVKLRVVEEVECKDEGKDEVWCRWLGCPCGESTPVGSKYCPGCGNKIKRP